MKHLAAIALAAAVLAAAPPGLRAQPVDFSTDFNIPGVDGDIDVMYEYDGKLFVGGAFNFINDLPVKNLATWDGTGWTDVGGPAGLGHVYAMTTFQGDLCVGAGNGIWLWDGSVGQWILHTTLGRVYGFADWNGQLVIGGDFNSTSYGAGCLRVWDGGSWSFFGVPLTEYPYYIITDVVVYDGDLIVTGTFNYNGPKPAFDGIARFDGTAWQPLSGVYESSPSQKGHMLVYGGDLYVCTGGDQTIEGVPVSGLARWDGSTWTSAGAGLPSSAFKLFARSNHLVAAVTGGLEVMDGGVFTPQGGTVESIYATSDYLGQTYIGGSFGSIETGGAGQAYSPHLAIWDGDAAWIPFPGTRGGGFTYSVYDLCDFDGQVCAQSLSTMAGTVPGFEYMQWDGDTWHAVAGNADERYNTTLCSTEWNGRIARSRTGHGVEVWDGSAWQVIGNHWENVPHAMIEYNGDLIVGDTGSTGVVPIAQRWDGTAWHDMGPAYDDPYVYDVTQFIIYNGDLLLCGRFGPGKHLARWTGSTWVPFAGGANQPVYCMAISGGRLVAGGAFTVIGGDSIPVIARLTPGGWTNLGTAYPAGPSRYVTMLAASGDEIWVAVNAIQVYDVARWTDSNGAWEGFSDRIRYSDLNAMIGMPEGVYLAGTFISVDGIRADHIILSKQPVASSVGDEVPLTALPCRTYPNPFNPSTSIRFDLPRSSVVKVRIYDARGRRVRDLLAEVQNAGTHDVVWDGRGDDGRTAPSGVYFARIDADGLHETVKMALVK